MRLAIFDFDGTLVDTAPWFFGTVNSMARTYGFREIAAEEGEALRSLPTRAILVQLKVPLWKLPQIAADLRRQALANEAAIPLFPWVNDLFAELSQAGVVVAIASSNSEAMIRRKLGKAMQHVHQVSAESSLFGKPARLRNIVSLCRPVPQTIICIGDELRDIEASRSVGATSIAVTWGLASLQALQAAKPDRVVADPVELRTALLDLASLAGDRSGQHPA